MLKMRYVPCFFGSLWVYVKSIQREFMSQAMAASVMNSNMTKSQADTNKNKTNPMA
jgi:hypothetical protein